MQTISKLSDDCKKCKYFDACDNKRMGACAMSEFKTNAMDNTVLKTMSLAQPTRKTEHQIKISTIIGEDFSEQLKKDFYRKLDCSYDYK